MAGDQMLEETKSMFEEISYCLKEHAQIALGNLIIQLAQRVFPETIQDTNNSRLLAKCQVVTDQQLRDASIPKKYWRFIKDLKTYNQNRNRAAHQTSVQLANLLSTVTLRRAGISDQWADAYRLIYNHPYEEMTGDTLSMYEVRES